MKGERFECDGGGLGGMNGVVEGGCWTKEYCWTRSVKGVSDGGG